MEENNIRGGRGREYGIFCARNHKKVITVRVKKVPVLLEEGPWRGKGTRKGRGCQTDHH